MKKWDSYNNALFHTIWLNILIGLVCRYLFPVLSHGLDMPLIWVCFTLALISAIIRRNFLSYYKPDKLWLDVLISTLCTFAISNIHIIIPYIITIQAVVYNVIISIISDDNTELSSKDNDKAPQSSSKNDPVNSPLDQFEIRNVLSLDVPILANFHLCLTNIRLYLTISAFIALILNFLARKSKKVICNRLSISQESIYATIHSIVINQINEIKGQMYFPFIYALFILILINNLIGMVPYSFASTSHFSLTFFMSFTVVLGATILGFIKHGLKFFSLFVPAGCPLALLPLLVLIEFISYLARNVSLGLRLAANILSGHMLLNILSGFAYNIMTSGFISLFIGLIPLAFIIAFSGLELGIAFIQAQVFVVLTSSYIKDALDLH